MMIDNIQNIFERRGFVDMCKKLITVIALCVIAAGILLVIFSPSIKLLTESILGRAARPVTALKWRAFIGLLGIFIPLFCIIVLCYLYSQKIPDKTKINILYICIAGILAVSAYMAHKYGGQWIDSDMASEMILGNLLAKENKLVTSSWEYSAEIRLVYQQLFFMPLFKLFDDWRVVRAITVLLNNIVLLASYFFMMKQFRVSKKTVLLTSLFLILPVSMVYWGIVLFGGYYVFFIAMFFCYLGLFAILLNSGKSGKKTNAAFILFALLSFVFGAGGVRALMNIYVPVFITVSFVCFTRKDTRLNSRPFLLGAAGLVLCGLGYAANFVLHFFYRFHSHNGESILDLDNIFFQKLGNTIYSFVEFLGFTPNEPFISSQGILSFAAIVVVFLIFYEAVKILKRRGADGKAEINVLFVLFFIVSTIYHIILFQMVDGDFRHLMPLHILYIPALAVIFEFVKKNMPLKKARLFICGIAFVILGSGLMRLYILPSYDYNNHRKDSIAYIEENNLRFGFASFWNANVLMELTNGRIEMLGLSPGNIHTISGWLHVIAYEDPGYYKGETFLLLTKEELEAEEDEEFFLRQPDYEDDYFIIFRYPSAEVVFDEVLKEE
jgi:hypothetical protein